MMDAVDAVPPGSRAMVLSGGLLGTSDAKTTHGLLRFSERFIISAVVDAAHVGRDAGDVMDGARCGVPVVASVAEGVAADPGVAVCIIGIATHGGVLPECLFESIRSAIDHGLHVVNGLHQPLAAESALVKHAAKRGVRLIDIRKPRSFFDLRHWTGEILGITVPRIAFLGTDCATGKRTTTRIVQMGLQEKRIYAEMIYTGQTGWLQGADYGTILDAIPNDFVCGELERAIVQCVKERSPDVLLVEGQSSLCNPSGPCGSELLLACGATRVVLQHAPGRRYYDGFEELRIEIPPVEREIDLIRHYGAEVVAIALNEEGLTHEELQTEQCRIEAELGIRTFRPLGQQDALAHHIAQILQTLRAAP